MTEVMDHYPEHEKLAKIVDQSQTCGEFLEWLEQHGYRLCEVDEDEDGYWPTGRSITSLLAEFFDIDQKKIDAEKEEMLDELRALQSLKEALNTNEGDDQ